ncbi:hypothetical protein ACFL1B_04140 [Nanoarchaeota archaeon]
MIDKDAFEDFKGQVELHGNMDDFSFKGVCRRATPIEAKRMRKELDRVFKK